MSPPADTAPRKMANSGDGSPRAGEMGAGVCSGGGKGRTGRDAHSWGHPCGTRQRGGSYLLCPGAAAADEPQPLPRYGSVGAESVNRNLRVWGPLLNLERRGGEASLRGGRGGGGTGLSLIDVAPRQGLVSPLPGHGPAPGAAAGGTATGSLRSRKSPGKQREVTVLFPTASAEGTGDTGSRAGWDGDAAEPQAPHSRALLPWLGVAEVPLPPIMGTAGPQPPTLAAQGA